MKKPPTDVPFEVVGDTRKPWRKGHATPFERVMLLLAVAFMIYVAIVQVGAKHPIDPRSAADALPAPTEPAAR